MKKNWSLVVAGVVILVLVIASVLIFVKGKPSDINSNNGEVNNVGDTGTISSNGEAIDKPIEVEGFVVENLSLVYEDGYTILKGDIVNNTEVDYFEGASFNVSLYMDDQILITVPILSSTLVADGKSSFESKITMDCSMATRVKVELTGTY